MNWIVEVTESLIEVDMKQVNTPMMNNHKRVHVKIICVVKEKVVFKMWALDKLTIIIINNKTVSYWMK